MTQETAVDECQAVTLGMQGHSLSQTGRIILDGDILQRNFAALYLECKGAEGANLWQFAIGSWQLAGPPRETNVFAYGSSQVALVVKNPPFQCK